MENLFERKGTRTDLAAAAPIERERRERGG